jgi:sulfopyruvate decarboxylase subunit alpha
MVTGAEFYRLLVHADFDFFTGVPCSLVKGLIAVLEEQPTYVAETREDAAVGLAAGAYLADKQPVVIMQNSGLGVCINALASLSLLYRLPCLLLITWRGYQGKDAPEHLIMGDISPTLLATLDIPYRTLAKDTVGDDIKWAATTLNQRRQPVALLVPPGVMA